MSGIALSYTYTCRAITSEPVVTRYGETLVRDQDYTVSYRNNRGVGTATAVISVTSGERFDITFEIVSADIVDAELGRRTSAVRIWEVPDASRWRVSS